MRKCTTIPKISPLRTGVNFVILDTLHSCSPCNFTRDYVCFGALRKSKLATLLSPLIPAIRRFADCICYLLFVRTAFRTSYEDLKCVPLGPRRHPSFQVFLGKGNFLVVTLFFRDLWATRITRAPSLLELVVRRTPINCTYFLLSSCFPPHHATATLVAFVTNLSQRHDVKRNLSEISRLFIKRRAYIRKYVKLISRIRLSVRGEVKFP